MNSDAHTKDNLLKLLTWFSPGFPVGSYSYSHGIEFAVEAHLVKDAESLRIWIEGIMHYGVGCKDGILFSEAWKAVTNKEEDRLSEIAEIGNAFQPTTEMALESKAQGAAFLNAICAAWPSWQLTHILELLNHKTDSVAYPVAVGVTSAIHSLTLNEALSAYLNSVSTNLVSAGIRLIPLGQTSGLQIISGLAKCILKVKETILESSLKDIAGATLLVDWTSACHETQHTRLFRS